MKRAIRIPLLYLLIVALLLLISSLLHLVWLSLIAYALSLPWCLFVGMIIPNVWAGIPISIGALFNAAMIYAFLSNK